MNSRLYRLRAESLSLSPVIVPIYCLTLRGTIIIPLLRHEHWEQRKAVGLAEPAFSSRLFILSL